MATDPFTPGFGGAFQGIPQRTLPDDCIEYTLLIVGADGDDNAAEIRAQLEQVKVAAGEIVRESVGGYIWQRDKFQVEVVGGEGGGGGPLRLHGRTEYGDSVDDEWLVVWILRELSKGFGNLWIRVYDTDGEFLLIEAANTLPRWLNPEMADHRVWINSGNLLIIPPSAAHHNLASSPPSQSKATKPISRPLSLSEALSTITTATTTATTSPRSATLQRIRLVEEEAFYRLSRYPQAVKDHLHHAVVQVPRKVAMVLNELPESIASAVEAFYLRDPISLKALKTMANFPLSDGDVVTVSARFTKVLYAQLKSQEFDPPAESGYGIPVRGTEDFNAVDIGMKVACGFEMLVSDDAAPQMSSASRRKTVQLVKEVLREKTPPTDEAIANWGKRADGEGWLDINYEEFERNLQGQHSKREKRQESGWGDKQAEETLKKMVERFEAFLNDEDAGAEGAELGEMDIDNDDDGEDGGSGEEEDAGAEDSDGEDKGISFDEEEFSKMMREMMGMPAENARENEEAEIRKVMDKMQRELEEAGAIERPQGEDEEDEVKIDYVLAKNMLESFKGQGGLSGPGGNLLAQMGIVLPRDDPGEPR